MIRILVDSTADFSLEELKARNIDMVPLNVNFGEESLQDIVELDVESFYERLIHGDVHPKTSLPSPAAFLEKFEAAQEAGDELICILLSGGLSGTCQSAVNAKAMVDYEGIHIIDSKSTACVIRIMVEKAEKMIAEGKSAAEIVEVLEELKSRSQIFAAVDTLEYLQKGGRLSKAAAAIGSLASLKPIITLNREGELEVPGKCLGKLRALNWLMDALKKNPMDEDHALYTIYTHGTENTEKLNEMLAKAGIPVAGTYHIGSTIGTHVGPGAFGIIYIRKQ